MDSADGLVVFTHLWWTSTVPEEDPFAPEPAVLHANRARVLGLPELRTIVPGHGAPFDPGPDTPGSSAPQVRPSARAAAAMSSGVVPQQPPISDAPASFQARGLSGGRASCLGGSVHVLRIGSQNEPRFG